MLLMTQNKTLLQFDPFLLKVENLSFQLIVKDFGPN